MIFVLQWVITHFLNVFFKLYKYHGLTIQQWLFAIFFGALTLLLSQILRLLPFGKPDDATDSTKLQPD